MRHLSLERLHELLGLELELLEGSFDVAFGDAVVGLDGADGCLDGLLKPLQLAQRPVALFFQLAHNALGRSHRLLQTAQLSNACRSKKTTLSDLQMEFQIHLKTRKKHWQHRSILMEFRKSMKRL